MQHTLPLQQLIETARRSGRTTRELMALAECSRINLWRLATGRVPEDSPSGQRLRIALEGDALSATMSIVSASIRDLIAEDPSRADEVLAMLRSVTALVRRAGATATSTVSPGVGGVAMSETGQRVKP